MHSNKITAKVVNSPEDTNDSEIDTDNDHSLMDMITQNKRVVKTTA